MILWVFLTIGLIGLGLLWLRFAANSMTNLVVIVDQRRLYQTGTDRCRLRSCGLVCNAGYNNCGDSHTRYAGDSHVSLP